MQEYLGVRKADVEERQTEAQKDQSVSQSFKHEARRVWERTSIGGGI